jgi:hypothetical protein
MQPDAPPAPEVRCQGYYLGPRHISHNMGFITVGASWALRTVSGGPNREGGRPAAQPHHDRHRHDADPRLLAGLWRPDLRPGQRQPSEIQPRNRVR